MWRRKMAKRTFSIASRRSKKIVDEKMNGVITKTKEISYIFDLGENDIGNELSELMSTYSDNLEKEWQEDLEGYGEEDEENEDEDDQGPQSGEEKVEESESFKGE
jgi:hypothetical protein